MSELCRLATTTEAQPTLPRTLRILAENTLRNGWRDGTLVVLERKPAPLRLRPARLVMQDLLAVALLANLASLRQPINAKAHQRRPLQRLAPGDSTEWLAAAAVLIAPIFASIPCK